MLYRWLLWFGCFFICYSYAQEPLITAPTWPELKLKTEYIVEGMPEGNLSGLAVCGGTLWAESDRADQHIYQLIPSKKEVKASSPPYLLAQVKSFTVPPVPKGGLHWWDGITNVAISQFRGGGVLDFEGISCDQRGNYYVVSEAYMSVLKLTSQGEATWLTLPDELWQQAQQQGLLQKYNQLFEGIAVDPAGKRLWLAAERNKRGLLALEKTDSGWQCPNHQCVLLAEGGKEPFPKAFRRKRVDVRDFSDMAFYEDKLFTLERGAYRICRRSLAGQVEQCWSIANEALQPNRQYKAYGMPEALWITPKGAWVGIDNDSGNPRLDGEKRPIVWFFSAPVTGWVVR